MILRLYVLFMLFRLSSYGIHMAFLFLLVYFLLISTPLYAVHLNDSIALIGVLLPPPCPYFAFRQTILNGSSAVFGSF